VIYNYPDVVTSNFVGIFEGEEKCNLFAALAPELWPKKTDVHIATTCNHDGAWNPGEKPRWQEKYSPCFAGKVVVIFVDNDLKGRTWAEYIAASVYPYAKAVFIIYFSDQREHYDIADWIKERADPEQLLNDLRRLIESAPPYKPAQQQGAVDGPWAAETMDTFLAEDDIEVAWLVQCVLLPGCLTQIFAPRGIGKSILAAFWAVLLALAGKRVLILDRDNPRKEVKSRLRSLGADDLGELKANLKVISREKCPPLTRPDLWALFPYADYDVVIVDSWDSMAEGVGEQDSTKPALAMAPLLNICHREGGPAVLLLGNTIKSAEHSRGSGVIEDRADIVFEVRDATGFVPTGNNPWIEELPAQGAEEWAARSSRRKARTKFRLALVATKFRVGEEPPPRMFEVNLTDEPWSVTDFTAEVDKEGEAERQRKAEQKVARIADGVAVFLREIESRSASGQPTILKTAAATFLMEKKFTRTEAKTIIASESFLAVPGTGKGRPIELHRRGQNEKSAEMDPHVNPAPDAGFVESDFCRPDMKHTAEIPPSEPRINTGDFASAIFSAGPDLYTPPNGPDRTDSGPEAEHKRLVREIERLVESGDDVVLDDDYFFAHIQGRREDILNAIQSAIDQGLIGSEGGSDA
jgi:hypothetical protein